MKDKLLLNIIHRPELMPEYSINSTGESDIKKVISESLDIFKFQQECAHKNGLKTTIQMTYASLFNDEAIQLAKEHHKKYGDEIALSLLGLPCKQFKEKYKTDDFCIWMFSKEDKMAIVDDVFALFYQKFGFYPSSTGSYFLDSFTINYIKEKYPSVICAIATCWEEGPKAYRTCNNSWYTFFDGGPWNPWIPSKINSHCPAVNELDDAGIVAIPHLSRDLLACFDGNGSNFGTHPQNVIRGMIYYDNKYPYLFNLIDQYYHLRKYNEGYSYNMMFVGPGWLNKKGRWEAPYELLAKSYEDVMLYYGNLKKENKLVDQTMEEFAKYYRLIKKYKTPEVALWKDILYGSNKQYFWYIDPSFRFCLDLNQGGAMIDLRPYVAKIPQEVGIGTKNVYDASYPYLVQANYRAGFFTHYAGEGTIKSCRVHYKNESVDLCLTRTMAKYQKVDDCTIVESDVVDIVLAGLVIKIKSTFKVYEGKPEIITIRSIENDLNGEEIIIEEYINAGFGTTEYQSDLSNVVLGIGDETINYSYKDRSIASEENFSPYAIIPNVNTKITLIGDTHCHLAKAKEGIAFSPLFTLSIKKKLKKGYLETCLNLQKAN